MKLFCSLFVAFFLFSAGARAEMGLESGDTFNVQGQEVYVHLVCATEGRLISRGAVGCGYYEIEPVASDFLQGKKVPSAFLAHLQWKQGETYLNYDGVAGRSEETVDLMDLLSGPEQTITYELHGRTSNGEVQVLDAGQFELYADFEVENLGWTTLTYAAPWEHECWTHQPTPMETCLRVAPRMETENRTVRRIPLPQ